MHQTTEEIGNHPEDVFCSREDGSERVEGGEEHGGEGVVDGVEEGGEGGEEVGHGFLLNWG